MKNIFRHLLSFILPFTVLIIVPLCIEKNISLHSILVTLTGCLIIASGLIIMILTIFKFATIGRGTLAPWSPTKKLVISGLYKYVRNPMIIGVFLVLIGESLMVLSIYILSWAVLFFFINTTYFIVFEEPGLKKRFGYEYLEYKQHVRRWIPRITPYNPL